MFDALSLKRLNDRQTDIVWKRGGKVVMMGKSVISADGKAITITQTGTDPQGQGSSSTSA